MSEVDAMDLDKYMAYMNARSLLTSLGYVVISEAEDYKTRQKIESLEKEVTWFERKYEMDIVNKRIYRANDAASDNDEKFTKLIAFAHKHPIVFKSVMKAYNTRPDIRFGDTLLVFCSCVKSGEIKI